MPVGRMIGLVLALAIVAAVGLWIARSGPSNTPLVGDATVDRDSADVLEAAGAEAPGLQTRARRVPTGREPAAPPMELRDTDWVIEITEVVCADGSSAIGTSFELERPTPAGAHAGDALWQFPWEGEPLQIRLRLEDPSTAGERDPRPLPTYRPGDVVLLSFWQQDCAPWFSAPVCPPDRRSQIKVRLEAPRTLRGLVLAQGGAAPPASETEVQLTLPGVPAALYSVETDVDVTGRFAFDPDDLPRVPFLLTAVPDDRGADGCPSTVRVAPDVAEVSLTLGRSHRFTLLLDFEEQVRTERFGVRQVRFMAVEGSAGQDDEDVGYYAVDLAARRSAVDARYEPLQVLLPEGPDERWRVVVPGYRPVDVLLRPSGEERRHDMRVRLRPAADSGLLIVDGGSAEEARPLAVSGNLWIREGAREVPTHWRLPAWERPGHLRGAVRLPSGRPVTARLTAQPLEFQSDRSWGIAPFRVTLAPGQVYEHKALVAPCGTLVVVRKRDPAAKLHPKLVVRCTRAGVASHFSGWRPDGPKGPGEARRLMLTLPPGRWVVELLRDGALLDWSEAVQIESDQTTRVELPLVERLK